MGEENKVKLNESIDVSLSLKERVSKAVGDFHGINSGPNLSSVLNAISSEKSTMEETYKAISDEIERELVISLAEVHDLKMKILNIDLELLSKEKELNKYCSIYSRVPPLKGDSQDPNYQYFLDKYNQGTTLSQDISKLNFKIHDLLNVQRTLDNAFAGNVIELSYLVNKLSDLLKNFRSVISSATVERYKVKYCSFDKLNRMIEEKNLNFDKEVEKVRKLSSDSYKIGSYSPRSSGV